MSSSLEEGPAIGPYHMQCCDESRTLVIDAAHVIRFTPLEYRLLKPLLSTQPVSEQSLVQAAFAYVACESEPTVLKTLDKHIDRIRSKLRPYGLSIHRITRYGYLLLPSGVEGES